MNAEYYNPPGFTLPAWAAAVLLLIAVLGCTQAAWAADSQDFGLMLQQGIVKTSVELFEAETSRVAADIQSAATRLFWILCSVAIVVNGIKLIFKDGDLQAFFAVLVRFVIIIGIFHFLLVNGAQIGAEVINSLTSLTSRSGGGPAELADRIIDVTVAVLRSVSRTESAISISMLTMSLTLIIFDFILFGVVASCLVLYLSSYILCVVGVFVLGFGALSFTRQFAVNYLQLIIATGLELMTMILICNVGISAMDRLAEYIESVGTTSFSTQGVLLLCSVLLWSTSRVLPAMVGSLISGFDGSGRSGGIFRGFAAEIHLPAAPIRRAFSGGSSGRSRR